MCSRVNPSNGKRRKRIGENTALPGSACKQQFVGVTIGVVDVKSLIEHDGED